MSHHIDKLDTEYRIVANDTGNVEITVSKRLPNAWYLISACYNLLLINAKPAHKPPTN